jgi:plastocyanin
MKRREFFRRAGIGSAALVTLGSPARSDAASKSHAQQHPTISGPLATATVSFGAWTALPGTGTLNRFPNVGQAPGVANNVHAMIPHEVKIKAGGSVNFIIAGFHLLAIYDDGTQPGDISTATLISPTITPPAPPLINDTRNRIYFGIDPSVLPRLAPPNPPVPPASPPLQDRVEVVHFPNPGTFLVICAVLPHFVDGMFGYVDVNP